MTEAEGDQGKKTKESGRNLTTERGTAILFRGLQGSLRG